jgi:hypothetical protein
MDPHAALLTLARQFVAAQRMLATMQRGAQTAKAASPDAPEAAAPCEEFERLETAWYTKRLPNLAASNTVGDRGILTRPGRSWRAWTTTQTRMEQQVFCVAQRIQRGSNAIEVINR